MNNILNKLTELASKWWNQDNVGLCKLDGKTLHKSASLWLSRVITRWKCMRWSNEPLNLSYMFNLGIEKCCEASWCSIECIDKVATMPSRIRKVELVFRAPCRGWSGGNREWTLNMVCVVFTYFGSALKWVLSVTSFTGYCRSVDSAMGMVN